MGIFYERAFWGFIALFGAFSAILLKQFKEVSNTQQELKSERLEKRIIASISEKIEAIEADIEKLNQELISLKRHEKNHSDQQISILKNIEEFLKDVNASKLKEIIK